MECFNILANSLPTLFFLQVAFSFFIGAMVVTLATTLAERLGSTLGGVIGGLPSTVVVSLFFIAIVSGEHAAAQAAGIIPLIMGFCGIFLVSYALLSQRLTAEVSILLSLLVWFFLSNLSYVFQPIPFGVNLVAFFFLFAFCGWIITRKLVLPTSEGNRAAVSFSQLAGRGFLAGSVIASAVAAAKLSGPVLSAILAGFPAIMSSSMWIAARSRGVAYSHALITPLFFSCMINVTLYALLVRYLYPGLDIFWGTLLAYACSLLSAYAVFRYMRRLATRSFVLSPDD